MPRRPRIVRPSGNGRSSVLLATVLAAVGTAAAARAHGAPAPTGLTLADGVRRLRAVVVGDVRPLASRDSGVDGNAPAPGRGTSRLGRRAPAPDAPAAPRNTVVGVPWWSDSVDWGPDVVRYVDRTSPTLVADAGDTVALPTPELPAVLPAALRDRGVHWESAGAVTLLGGGRAVLDAPGVAVITAVTPVGRTRTPVTVRPVVRGRLYPGDDRDAGAPVVARVIVRRGAAADTTWTDAAGRFRLALPGETDAEVPADVRVEPAAGAPAVYAPVVLHAVPAAQLHTLGVLLLPTRWTVTAGSFAGTTVPVRAASARGFWQFTREHGRPVGWLRAGPLTVALPPALDAADSATFWRAAEALSAAWGRLLYIPADPADTSDDRMADVVVRAVPGLRAEGFTSLGWDGSGAVSHAEIDFRVRHAGALEPQVVAHELLHALGFGHARGWASVLAPAGAPLAAAPTAADVAYGQLHEALRRQTRRAEDAYGAAYGTATGGSTP